MSDTARNPEEGKGHTCHNGVTHHDVCPCRQELAEENLRLTGAIKKAVMRLGSPTMDYEPGIAVREYKDSIEEATKVLLKALAEPGEGDKA